MVQLNFSQDGSARRSLFSVTTSAVVSYSRTASTSLVTTLNASQIWSMSALATASFSNASSGSSATNSHAEARSRPNSARCDMAPSTFTRRPPKATILELSASCVASRTEHKVPTASPGRRTTNPDLASTHSRSISLYRGSKMFKTTSSPGTIVTPASMNSGGQSTNACSKTTDPVAASDSGAGSATSAGSTGRKSVLAAVALSLTWSGAINASAFANARGGGASMSAAPTISVADPAAGPSASAQRPAMSSSPMTGLTRSPLRLNREVSPSAAPIT
mmetsp:Transcript_15265/g.51326  ORF Transcript_15265/g.51326 Transcript_15265/m.51326 type:complete len:277 (-) Transcript_15265:581-1411(-)